MSRFQMTLRQPNIGLLIIGFGFNDLHIVQPIMSAIKSISVENYDSRSGNKESTNIALKKEGLIKAGDPRLTLLAQSSKILYHLYLI